MFTGIGMPWSYKQVLLEDIAEELFGKTDIDKGEALAPIIRNLALYLLDNKTGGGEPFYEGLSRVKSPYYNEKYEWAFLVLDEWSRINRDGGAKGGFLLSVLATLFRNDERKMELLTEKFAAKLLNHPYWRLDKGKRGYTCACSDRPSHGQ